MARIHYEPSFESFVVEDETAPTRRPALAIAGCRLHTLFPASPVRKSCLFNVLQGSPQFTSWPLPLSALPLLRSSSRDNTLTGQLGVIRMCNYEVAGGDMSSKRMVLAPTSVQTELVSRPCMGLRNCRKREGLGDGPDAIGLLARSTMQVPVVADIAATGRPRLDHSEMLFMPRQRRPFWGPSPTEHITSSPVVFLSRAWPIIHVCRACQPH